MPSALQLVLTFALVVGVHVGTDECLYSKMEECLREVSPLTDNPRLSGLASNKEDLMLACKAFETGMKCVDDYALRCLKAEQRALMEKKVSGARDAMTKICNNSYLQGGHWHYQCFRELSSSVSRCMTPFQRVWQQKISPTKDNNIRELCCAQRKMLSCMLPEAKRICEPSGISAAMNLIEIVFTPHLRQKCRAITNPCSGSQRITWSALPLACLALLRLLWAVA